MNPFWGTHTAYYIFCRVGFLPYCWSACVIATLSIVKFNSNWLLSLCFTHSSDVCFSYSSGLQRLTVSDWSWSPTLVMYGTLLILGLLYCLLLGSRWGWSIITRLLHGYELHNCNRGEMKFLYQAIIKKEL